MTTSPLGKFRKHGRMTTLERMTLACSPTEARSSRDIIDHLPEGTNTASVTHDLWLLPVYNLCTREQQDGTYRYTLTKHGQAVQAILLAELADTGSHP